MAAAGVLHTLPPRREGKGKARDGGEGGGAWCRNVLTLLAEAPVWWSPDSSQAKESYNRALVPR